MQHFETVDDYINSFPEHQRKVFRKIRQLIRDTVPEATEQISYQMPGYKFHGMLCWFAGFSNHNSLFVKPAVMQHFLDELEDYKITKSAIHFPFHKALPEELIARIIAYAAQANLKH
jgi:uncharacterized protein YdhG (YjbR/CyaY superfamily)